METTTLTNRSMYITSLVMEGLASPASAAAANKVLEGAKRWSGLTVGAQPLARDINLPEAYVAKILALIARQGYLMPTQYENVYKFHGSAHSLQIAAYITDHGQIIQKGGANTRPDYWKGAR